MVDRKAHEDIKELLEAFPAIMLSGPRQVGKTTLTKQIATTLEKPSFYLDLEKPEDYKILKDNAWGFLLSMKDSCVIIDEVQLLPSLLNTLRALIDEYRIPGRFILLGSANLNLIKGVSESLAGRIIYLDICQINLIVALNANISLETHWFNGGFPEQLLSKSTKT